MITFKYKPDGDVTKAFLKDDTFFRGIRGPVGSGKSVACSIEVFRRALQQEKSADGKRKSRWAIIRNTNPQLRTTTIKTWLDWFPEEEWGRFQWSVPYTHRITKSDLDLEVIFLALDRPEDVKKLLSLELSGIWINEAREIPKSIIDACTMRVGRYPSMRDGGPTWSGVIADTNAPEEDHWWAIMAGDVPVPDHIPIDEARMLIKPDNWRFFTQPPAMLEDKDEEGSVLNYSRNPKAENSKHMMQNYYSNLVQGKTKSWIDVYVMNRLGTIQDGKPVYNMFSSETHIAKEEIPIADGQPIYIGVDFGLTPACVFGQKVRGRWLLLQEIVAFDMGIVRFAELLRQEIALRYNNCEVNIFGDPAGDFRAQTDESTPFQILRGAGLKARPTHSNDVSLRIESVTSVLTRMVEGQSGVLIDRRCKELIKGFEGGYHYKRIQVSGERYDDKPNKDRFSHIHDALQYLLLGSGEGRQVMGQFKQAKTFNARTEFDVFTRQPRRVVRQGFRSRL
ncbi:large subunit terminase [uncultured Mediterranean phage uvMED]|nr:large subunit terminase [uncultured Mediterranean phage uvMED]